MKMFTAFCKFFSCRQIPFCKLFDSIFDRIIYACNNFKLIFAKVTLQMMWSLGKSAVFINPERFTFQAESALKKVVTEYIHHITSKASA